MTLWRAVPLAEVTYWPEPYGPDPIVFGPPYWAKDDPLRAVPDVLGQQLISEPDTPSAS